MHSQHVFLHFAIFSLRGVLVAACCCHLHVKTCRSSQGNGVACTLEPFFRSNPPHHSNWGYKKNSSHFLPAPQKTEQVYRLNSNLGIFQTKTTELRYLYVDMNVLEEMTIQREQVISPRDHGVSRSHHLA